MILFKFHYSVLIGFLCLVVNLSLFGAVRINELVAWNRSGLQDEDLEAQDWIELHNTGATAVDLTDWSITDDSRVPDLWVFPQVTLNPGQYLVVFASGKDRRAPAGTNRLHTNFQLKHGGSYLALFDASIPRKVVSDFAAGYPEQAPDHSYGIASSGKPLYYSTPTPGAANSATGLEGKVAAPEFSLQSGHYHQSVLLTLSTPTPGAVIRYTTNGSLPALTNGIAYSNPLPLSKTAVIRAGAFKSGQVPSRAETRSYFFIKDLFSQAALPLGYPASWGARTADYQMDQRVITNALYKHTIGADLLSLPTLSLVIERSDLFGPNGLYSNLGSSGPGWERLASAELIGSEGDTRFRIDGGLQMQGGSSRVNAIKNSMRINFKELYGESSLKQRIYPTTPLDRFNTLVIDAGYNLTWNHNDAGQRGQGQYVRDQFMSDLQKAMGWPSPHGFFSHLYLNELYWGIHGIHERPDEHFCAAYFGGRPQDYDVVRNTDGFAVVAGSDTEWNTLIALSNPAAAVEEVYQRIRQYLDVPNFIDYMILNFYGGNNDWPSHNWYAGRLRAPGAGFRFFNWDGEITLRGEGDDRTLANDAATPGQIYTALRSNAEFKLEFADHVHRHFFNGGILSVNPTQSAFDPSTPENNRPASLYWKRLQEIDRAIVLESARWGDLRRANQPYTRNDEWMAERERLLKSYFVKRSANVLTQLRTVGLYPAIVAPTLSRHGGNVASGYPLTLTAPAGTIYYTTDGSDPRTRLTGLASPSAKVYAAGSPVPINQTLRIKARVMNASGTETWSAMTEALFQVAEFGSPIRITELMVNPLEGDACEFIELENTGQETVDLGGFSFDGITYLFPVPTLLAASQRIVLASDVHPPTFAARYPGVTAGGYFRGTLANKGERIILRDRLGLEITRVDYDPAAGWPRQVFDSGASLEIVNPKRPSNDPGNWQSSNPNPTPGSANSPVQAPLILINEVMADNGGSVPGPEGFSDWIELWNPSDKEVNLSGWSVETRQHRYQFPAGTRLSADGYLILWCDEGFSTQLHTGFRLSRRGEELFLFNALGDRIDSVQFGPQVSDFSVGRVGGEWKLNVPTLAARNAPALTGDPSSVKLNEWLANPGQPSEDFLELYNSSSNQVVGVHGFCLEISSRQTILPSLSFIAPKGHQVFYADVSQGSLNPLQLPKEGGTLVLYADTGAEIDRVSYGAQSTEVSMGRLPDGSGPLKSFPGNSSPGAANYQLQWGGPFLNELMADNGKSTVDPRGGTPDWVELFNPNSTEWNLSGMGLRIGLEDSDVWKFPIGTRLGPSKYLVVWLDADRPSSFQAGDFNLGESLGNQGDTLSLLTADNQVVDQITFGQQIEDLSIGKSGSNWRLLGSPTPGRANSSATGQANLTRLRINEWSANGPEQDWIEAYNPEASPADLGGLFLSDEATVQGIRKHRIAPLTLLPSRGWVRWNTGGSSSRAHEIKFSLSAKGEMIRFSGTNSDAIDTVYFPAQPPNTSSGRLPDGATNVVNFPFTASPGGGNYLPLTQVAIHEVLSDGRPPLEDAVELINLTPSGVSVGGWYLSNNERNLKAYAIPAGTVLKGAGFKVFYENQFGGPSAQIPFSLDGDRTGRVFLSAADTTGALTGHRTSFTYRSVEPGRSWGSLGEAPLENGPLRNQTFGITNPTSVEVFRQGIGHSNAPAAIGPLVISEIQYHAAGVPRENSNLEFIELQNVSGEPLPLFLGEGVTAFRISGGVKFNLEEGVTLQPDQVIVLVPFNPTTDLKAANAFKAHYSTPSSMILAGPYQGALDNSGELLRLEKARTMLGNGFIPFALLEEVAFTDALPWPIEADGTGASLHRVEVNAYGNLPSNWKASPPSPGVGIRSPGLPDTDGDGMPDSWETLHELNPNNSLDASRDEDGDGHSNLQEYRAGTDPLKWADALRFTRIASPGDGTVRMTFEAKSGKQYRLLLSSQPEGPWQATPNLLTPQTSGPFEVIHSNTPEVQRYFRLRLETP